MYYMCIVTNQLAVTKQIVENRILSVSLLGNKLYQIVIHLVKNRWILEPPRRCYDFHPDQDDCPMIMS